MTKSSVSTCCTAPLKYRKGTIVSTGKMKKLRLIILRWLRAIPTELIPLDLQWEMFCRSAGKQEEKDLLESLNNGFCAHYTPITTKQNDREN